MIIIAIISVSINRFQGHPLPAVLWTVLFDGEKYKVYQVIYMYLILQIYMKRNSQATNKTWLIQTTHVHTVFRRMLACHKCAKWMLFIVPMNASTLTYKFLYRVITIKGCFIRPRKGRNIDGNAEMSIFV